MSNDDQNSGNTFSQADQDKARLLHWAEGVIEEKRYTSMAASVLAQYEHVPALMPTVAELDRLGVDLVGLAQALEQGLDPEQFGKALAHGFTSEMYEELLSTSLDGSGFDRINEALRSFNERQEASAPIMRSMHRRG